MIGDLRILLSFVVLLHGAVIPADIFRDFYQKVKMHMRDPSILPSCVTALLQV